MLSESHIQTVINASIKASHAIMEIYNTDFNASYKLDGSPVTIADITSSNILIKELESIDIPIITEEEGDFSYAKRKTWNQNWCIDPLDGTKDFLKKNDQFCISIALIYDQAPAFGLIASPCDEIIIYGGQEYGAYYTTFQNHKEGISPTKLSAKESVNDPLVICRSFSPLGSKSEIYLDYLKPKYGKIKFIKKGSALKFIDMALGKADLYTRFAPTMEWDIAGGHAILKALGGDVFDSETNKPLTYNKESLFNPHFIAKSGAFLKQEEE